MNPGRDQGFQPYDRASLIDWGTRSIPPSVDSTPLSDIVLPPIRHMSGQQCFEQLSVVGHPQVQQLVGNNEILKSRLLVG